MKKQQNSASIQNGFIHVYTGNGKGKTTAAMGLILRALGSGMRVYLVQFLKGRDSAERIALSRFEPQIEIHCCGSTEFIHGNPSGSDKRAAENGMEQARTAMLSGQYDMIVLDEAIVAADLGVISAERLADFADSKPVGIELIITGRNATTELLNKADLATEMRKIKHYYDQGVQARPGIEF